ncbi:unnamed protein product [Didymodactylos carnosus]|uniref:Uncharacterized protein n=1 Tax=Didymodactylos carnosus TaxID=1234261 RepID=A0A8S2HHA9_9BILA|nr:unnamed protein product [Didymodactylos carnosus]CAF3647527.1 unnamed protein product [Didymodactylos carnosus]
MAAPLAFNTKQQHYATKQKPHSNLRQQQPQQHSLNSFTGVWGEQFHIHQMVMIYDQKYARVPSVDFLQETIFKLDQQQRECLVKFDYNQLSGYVAFDDVFQMSFQGLEDDDMDHDKLACLKRIQSMEIHPSPVMKNNSLIVQSKHLNDQRSTDGSEWIDLREIYDHPFDSRYNSSEDDDEEEYSKANFQPIIPIVTPATVNKHYFHGQHIRDFACYLQTQYSIIKIRKLHFPDHGTKC